MKPPTLEIHDTGPPGYSLPVRGYHTAAARITLFNINKELEERALRCFEATLGSGAIDDDAMRIAITHLRTAFMWANRAVFQPERVRLEDDPKP